MIQASPRAVKIDSICSAWPCCHLHLNCFIRLGTGLPQRSWCLHALAQLGDVP